MTTNAVDVVEPPASPASVDARLGFGGGLRLIAADIKLSHSVFALPLAVLAAFLAGPERGGEGWPAFWGKLALVVICMVLARTWAMVVNRLLDRRIDAENARTRGRAFASGRVGPVLGWSVALFAAALFVGATWVFQKAWANPWPLWMSGPVLAWIGFYSLTKRFTAWCHVVLGSSLAMSVVAATIAVDPGALASPTPWWLAGFVLAWVAGFDVIYAMQDEAFDRSKDLKSVPARMGNAGAAWVSRLLHAGAVLCLLAAWSASARLEMVFGVGVAMVGVLLIIEHVIVARRGERGLQMAFFTINGIVSLALGLLGIADLLF
ncbi:MAG: 4-hydroxybenzoate octaprenyltransferase [Phycisphaerales bacterium]|nr:4-hydroxybenzoate octaprenyltransferase [Phycisphaerales bacterium]